jgi:hypothetical protein
VEIRPSRSLPPQNRIGKQASRGRTNLVVAAIPTATTSGGLVDVCGARMAVHDVDALLINKLLLSFGGI